MTQEKTDKEVLRCHCGREAKLRLLRFDVSSRKKLEFEFDSITSPFHAPFREGLPMKRRNLKTVVECVVPFLIAQSVPVNRQTIRSFLKSRNVYSPDDLRNEFDSPFGLMNNFCFEYQAHLGGK